MTQIEDDLRLKLVKAEKRIETLLKLVANRDSAINEAKAALNRVSTRR